MPIRHLLVLSATLISLSACDSGSATDGDSLGSAPLSACSEELSQSAAQTLLGTTLPDTGHTRNDHVSPPIRSCQWFSISGGLSAVNWQWFPSSAIYANMKANYAANQVRTLADGRICTQELEMHYLYRTLQVAGQEVMHLETANSSCAADGTDEQVWSVCRGTTVVTSVDRPGQTAAWKFQRADSVLARVCRAT